MSEGNKRKNTKEKKNAPKAKKRRTSEPKQTNVPSVTNSIDAPEDKVHYGKTIEIEGIIVTNELVKRVSAQSILSRILPDLNHDSRKNFINSFEKKYGNLGQYEIGKQGNKPRVMNVDSLRQFMELLSSKEHFRLRVEEFRGSAAYKDVITYLEDKSIVPASSIGTDGGTANAVHQIRQWLQQLKVTEVASSNEKFSLVQEYISSHMSHKPLITELYQVKNTKKNQKTNLKNTKKNQQSDNEDEEIYFVALTHSKFCMNIDGDHDTCCVCFTISVQGLRQICFDPISSGPSGPCKEYKSCHFIPPYPVSDDSILMKIFASGSQENRLQKKLRKYFNGQMKNPNPFATVNNNETYKRMVAHELAHREKLLALRSGGLLGSDQQVQRETEIAGRYIQPTNTTQPSLSPLVTDNLPNPTTEHDDFEVSGNPAAEASHSKVKMIRFLDPDGDKRKTSVGSLMLLQEYVAKVFNKQVNDISKFTYVDDEDEDTAVKDESNFQLIPDGTTLTIHWKQQ